MNGKIIKRKGEYEVMRNCGIKKVLFLLGVMVLVLSGCSSTKLAEAFDEETVKETAQEAVG